MVPEYEIDIGDDMIRTAIFLLDDFVAVIINVISIVPFAANQII